MGVLPHNLEKIDLNGSSAIYHSIGPGGFLGERIGRAFWEAVSFTCDGALWFGVIPAVFAAKNKNLSFLSSYEATLIMAGLLVDIIAICALKITFKRPRPPFHKPDPRFIGPDKHSFPSGHATRVWCLVTLGSMYAPQYQTALNLWGGVVTLGRVALGRHYLTDALAGTVVGIWALGPAASALHGAFWDSRTNL